jgi:predicted metalloprotease
MQWRSGRRSTEIEDRRGARRAGGVGAGGLGLGGLLLLMALGYFVTGDPLALLPSDTSSTPSDALGGAPTAPPAGDDAAQFVSVVLADTEDTWSALFAQMNRQYQRPRLVLFSDAVESACGLTSSAVGPFYCPGDARVYIDLSFYRDLDTRFGAPGDFAQAYVVAHEVGHHVQNLLGTAERIASSRVRASETEANALSVRQELQADCYAGVWGHHAAGRNLLEPGDIEEGLNAAAAIGDDRLQRRGQGRVTPETWTHGSSAQRVQWFRRGFDSGRVDNCDTFGSGSRP